MNLLRRGPVLSGPLPLGLQQAQVRVLLSPLFPWQVVHVFDVLLKRLRRTLRFPNLCSWMRLEPCCVGSRSPTLKLMLVQRARCFSSGAITGVALDEPLLFSEFPFTDGGAEYPVGSIVGA